MKFNVDALRAAAEQALVADRARWDEERAKSADEADKERARWLEDWGPAWLEASKVIARRIRKGEPVSREDIPGDRYHSVPTYDQRPVRQRDYMQPVELTGLLRVLDTVADEHVTTAGLRDLGVTAHVLRTCVAHMARSSVTS